jgi:cell division protein FtsB
MRIAMIILIVLLIWLQYELWFAHNGLLSSHKLHHQMILQHEKNQIAEKRNQKLMKDIHDLKNDPDVIAAQARRNFGMVKKGETYYAIVNHTPS